MPHVFQEGLVGGTRVFQNPESIPALQVPYFAACVVDCLHNGEQKKVFDWKVPEGVFQEGFVQDQAWNVSLTCDYFNYLGSSMTTLRKMNDLSWSFEDVINELELRIKWANYVEVYFCNPNCNWWGKYLAYGEEGWTHDKEAQKYLLDSQNYRAFYDFDREVWNLIKEIVEYAKNMKSNWISGEKIISFLKEHIWKIISDYSQLIRDVSTSWPKDKKMEISYTPEWRTKKILVLIIRDIPYEDYRFHRNGN